MSGLKKIGSHRVAHVKAAVRKAGDGLSASIAADGIETVEVGGHYYLLMEVDANGLSGKIDPDDPRSLNVTINLDAGTVTFVDKELAAPLLQEQADRNEQARIAAEEERGVHRLAFPGGADPDGEQ
jgi:hypothetical protein